LDTSLEIGFVMKAVKRAFSHAKPEIMNSDQGSYFTSNDYIEAFKSTKVKISMDGKGRALDNIFMRKFTLKSMRPLKEPEKS